MTQLTKCNSNYRPLSVFSDFDKIINHIFNDFSVESKSNSAKPRLNLRENKNDYVVEAELPGVNEKDIKLSIEDGYLNIEAERSVKESKSDDEKLHYRESYYGKFSRSIKLPENINENKVKASYKNGILEVSLKKEEVKDKRKVIPVN